MVAANVGIEILTKAVCIKREIDIFKQHKGDFADRSPFRMGGMYAPENPWLDPVF